MVMSKCPYCGEKLKNGEGCTHCGGQVQAFSGYVYQNQKKDSDRISKTAYILLFEAAAVFAAFIVLSLFDFGGSQELWERLNIGNIYIYEFALFCTIQALQMFFSILSLKFSYSLVFKRFLRIIVLISSTVMIAVFFISEMIAVGSLLILVGWFFLGDALCLGGYALLLMVLQIFIAVTANLKCGLKDNT